VPSGGGKPGDTVVFDTVIVSDIHQAEYLEVQMLVRSSSCKTAPSLPMYTVSQDELFIGAFWWGKPGDTVVFDTVIVAEVHQTEYLELPDVGEVFQL
jgi:signal peptidase I